MRNEGRSRAKAFAARKLAFEAGQGQAAEFWRIGLEPHQGKVLAGYMPMRTEIDPMPAMAAHQGAVCVPVIMGAGPAAAVSRMVAGHARWSQAILAR